MHDINLLPIHDRDKELDEIKKRQEAKKIVKIKMSSPEKENQLDSKKTENKSGNFWSVLKKKFNNFKKNKSEKEIHTVKSSEAGPQKAKFDRVKKLRNGKLSEKKNKKKLEQEKNKIQIPKHLDNIQAIKPKKEFIYNLKKNETVPNNSKPAELEEKKEIYSVKSSETEFNKVKKIKEKNNKNNLEEIKKQIGLYINLIPTKIKKAGETKHNLKIFITLITTSIFVCALIFLGLNQIVGAQSSDLERIENQLTQTTQQIDKLKTNNQKVNEFIKLLKNVKELVNNHIKVSSIFEMLQNNTLKNVYYNGFNVDTNNLTINLNAVAKDYHTAAKQILIFRSLDNIFDLETTQIKSILIEKELTAEEEKLSILPEKESLVLFELIIKLKPEVFKY